MTLLVGDINVDDKINILDAAMLACVFSLTNGQLGFDPKADINGDGVVDIFDLAMVGNNFGCSLNHTTLRSQRSADLSIPQFRALLFINRNPNSSLKNLAHHLGLTSPTVSKMVDGLVINRLVNRESSSKDRRKITLILTDQGQAILEKARNGAHARLAEVLSPLTPEESETVYQAMELLQSLFLPGSDQINP